MRLNLKGMVFSLVCGLFSTSMASAACDYYIAPGGSDSAAGTEAAPWKTIAYASSKLSPGRTLCARGGTYHGQAGYIWKSSGTASAPVTFKNYPNEVPVFDGDWGDTGTEGDFLVFSNHSNVVVDGITMQHFADQYGNGTIDIHNGLGPVDNIVIQNCTFIDNGSHTAQDHHIYIAAGSTNTTIRNNLFIRASGSAIQAYHTPAASGIRIYNNVMIGGTLKCSASKSNPCSATAQQHWGIIIGDAKDTQIYNNTIYGMQYGIDFNYGTAATGPYTVKNNLLVNNSVAGIRVASLYAPAYTGDYNGFYGNAADINWKGSNLTLAQFSSSTTNERHSIHANPSFVSSGSNFHLNSDSPMIDKGLSLSLFNTDKDWMSRPRGAGYDIGAYEYIGSTPVPTPIPDPTPAPAPAVSISTSATKLTPGQVFTVTVSGANSANADDYVALYLASAADADYSYKGQYKSLDGTTLQFTAPMEAGTYNLRYFGASNAQNRLAVSANLTVAAPPPAPVIGLSTTSLVFGSQRIGTTSAVQFVTITNKGNADLKFTSTVGITGDFASGNVGTCTGSAYPPGSSCTVSVVFKPTATGTRIGTLNIPSNASASPVSVGLSGTGLFVDSTAPLTAIKSPTNSSYISVGSYVTIQADASDNVAVKTVEFYVNGTLKCTASMAPYKCVWKVPLQRWVHYSLQTKARDAAGTVGVSSRVIVTSR